MSRGAQMGFYFHWAISDTPLVLRPFRGRGRNQVKLILPKFHRNRHRKYNNTALFMGGCWISLTGRFYRHSAAGWAECTVAGPGQVRRHTVHFSERPSTPLKGRARLAL